MPQTQIPFGSPLARKVFGAAVFGEVTRKITWGNRLTGPAPTQAEAEAKLREQTSPSYPFVRVTDLSQGRGDTVSVDLFNILQGKPIMGDAKISGKMMPLKYSSMDIKVDQARGGVDPGGRMAQQRTVHDLRTLGRAGVTGWWARYLDQMKMVHVAGARGDQDTPDWVIPLATDPDFANICVNPVYVPTYNRHFYAGDATSIATLDTTNIITLDELDKLRATIEDMDFPMQPVILDGDPAAEDEPLWVLYVTTRQWHYLQNRSGEKAWRTFLMNARERKATNPLFTGEPGLWNGILVRKMQRAIRFNQGTAVTVATSAKTYAETTSTVPTFVGGTPAGQHAVDRAILLGAQALAECWGKDSMSGYHMRWWEETTDHGNTVEASVSGILGQKKLRFAGSDGADTDHGIAVLDSYAPDPATVVVA